MVATNPLSQDLLLRLTGLQSRDEPLDLPAVARPHDAVREPAARAAEAGDVLRRLLARESDPSRRAGAAAAPPVEGLGDEPVCRLEELVQRLAHHSTAFGCVDWLDDSAQDLEQARELARLLAAQEIQLLVGLQRFAVARANDADGDAAFGSRMAAAAARLPEHTARIEHVLDEFHRLEAGLMRDDMRARRAECELEARRFREIVDRAEALRRRLSGGWVGLGRLFGRRLPAGRRVEMAERLRELTRRSRRCHAFLAEEEVLRWLDGVVEAGLHLPEADWLEELQEARLLLFQLLNVYCLQDRVPATELAGRVLLRADAHEQFEYCPECEDYLARYLARRRREMFGGGGGLAVDRLARFQRTREHLIEEYLSRSCGG